MSIVLMQPDYEAIVRFYYKLSRGWLQAEETIKPEGDIKTLVTNQPYKILEFL